MAQYDYINQWIVSSTLITSKADDGFYHPENTSFTGFAYDGQWYDGGHLDLNHAKASWYTEVTNPLLAVEVTNGGSEYTSAPTVSFIGSEGTGAAATAEVSGGAVTCILLTSPGHGYLTTPTVNLVGGGGKGATALAVTPGIFRGLNAEFPKAGLVLLSKVALTILDETTTDLSLWMQFILADSLALTDNFNGSLQGFQPTSVCCASGIISVTYTPDPGSSAVEPSTAMIVHLDFTQDNVYLDVASSATATPVVTGPVSRNIRLSTYVYSEGG
jgi:hypothetical protein